MSVRRLQHEWETLAGIDPLWAIVSDPAKRGNRWDQEAFFASGQGVVDFLFARLDELGITPAADAALDFGCGAGRLTQALADRFARAVGIDISPTMLKLAEQYNRHGDRCKYLLNPADDLALFGNQRFDLCFSFIVLQHMPPDVARGYITAMARLLEPGGVLAFQLPSRRLRDEVLPWWKRAVQVVTPMSWRFAVRRRLGDPTAGLMQMHTTPRPDVEALLDQLGLQRCAALESNAAGNAYESFLYLARRPVAP